MLKGSCLDSSNIIKQENNITYINCKQMDGAYLLNRLKVDSSSTYSNINGALKKENNGNVNNLIPRKIFQTHKNQNFINGNQQLKSAQMSWKKHKKYEYHFYNNKQQGDFMKLYFSDIYDAYLKCPLPVMKADLWRYCVIYKYGGIYADLDTICLTNPDVLIKNSYLVGVPENNMHLCQWVFSAPMNSPILKSIINLSVKRIRGTNKFIGKHFVHHHTGPSVFTEGIDEWLLSNNYPVITEKKKYINYPNNVLFFHGLDFHDNNVKHIFAGSWDGGWKQEKSRFLQKR